jgi:hypothetical protein
LSGGSSKIIPDDASAGAKTLWKTVSKTNWAVSLCLIGFVVSVFAFLNGSKVGLAGMGASAAGMFMGLALARFAMWMAVFGLIGSLVAGLASVLAKKKAISEIIGGVQSIREQIKGSQNNKTLLPVIDNALEEAQTKGTKKLVAVEKLKQKVKSIKKGL